MSPPLDVADVNDWVTAPQPKAAGGQPDVADVNDWVTAPGPASDTASAAPASPDAGRVTLEAAGNALAQGFTRGFGSMIAGAGQQVGTVASYKGAAAAQRQLDVIDAIDRHQDVADQDDPYGYQYLTDEGRAKARADLLGAVQNEGPETPNAVTRFGTAIKNAAATTFPVAPEAEGHVTNVARMVGGFVPAVGASAVGTLAGGPVGGLLAGAAVIGAQTYDDTYEEATAAGMTHQQADDAAGKASMAQMAVMSVPIGKVLPLIPLPLREGFLKTVVNLGQRGVEMGSGNELATLAQNYVAANSYDPGRSVFKGTGDAGIDGFLAGLIVHGPATAAGRPDPAALADRVMRAGSIDAAIKAATDGETSTATGGASGEAAAGGQPTGGPTGGLAQPGWGTLYGQREGSDASPVLTTAGGTKLPYRYEVAEAGDLTPASGDLQPRDRASRVASSGQIADIARRLDPELLHASPGPDQGAPTVDSNGTILAGNGRTRAIRLAYSNGNADAYRAMLERHGFDTGNMNEPVLIRRLTDTLSPDQARQFAVESNVSAGQRLSGTEQAAIDARGLTPAMLNTFDPTLTAGALAAGNRNFVRSWVATLPEAERNSVMDANGVLSADGQRRLQGAMLSLAYGDKGTLARALESTDDTTRGITGALTDAAPAVAQLQSAITEGRVPPELNIAPQITAAVDKIRQAREKGQSAADLLRQGDALNPLDPVTEGLIRVLYNDGLTQPASRASIAEILRRYAIEAGKASTEQGLFGDALPAVAPADILASVRAAVRKEPTIMPEASVAERAAAMGIRPQQAEVAAAVADNAEPGTFSVGDRVVTSNGPGTINGTTTRTLGDEPAQTTHSVKFDRGGRGDFAPDELSPETAAQPTEAAGAQVSTAAQARMGQQDFLDNRLQGEIERLARPARGGDSNLYIPGTRLSLAEVSGNPVTAMDQAYNRGQAEAMAQHTTREQWNGDQVAEYYGDTAESKQRLTRMERDRAALAQANIQKVFGDPNSKRPPADISRTQQLIRDFVTDPQQEERVAVNPTILKLQAQLVDAKGNAKSDPYRLYGIGKHIGDLLDGVGNADEVAAARVLKRELTLIKDSLYDDIEAAAPGFTKYRAEYQRDSRAINALRFLQEERLGLLSGTTQHITPAKWFNFMRGVVEGRADPMDPAASLSEAQMDRLWNITDHLKRSYLVNAGKPAGSWTAFMQEWGGRFARVAAHAAALHTVPVIGNIGVEMGSAALHSRNVRREADRLLNPERWPENLRPRPLP